MRFKYLDELKAFAIIAVVLYHSGFLTFGYLGVDLFLVISGYLTTISLYNKLFTSNLMISSERKGILKHGVGWRLYLRFVISRIVRLLPVLLIAGLVCMFVGFFVMLPDDYENLSESVIATNCFCNNILAAITTKNYWDVVNEYKPLMHTWYVGLVMQFYLFYPLLFLIARLDRKDPKRLLLLLVSSLAVVSLLIYFISSNTANRFYYLPSRFFEFALGGLVALAWKQKDRSCELRSWVVFLCYALLLALFIFNFNFIQAKIKLVLVVVLSVFLVMSSETLENQITANERFAKLGAASYSIFVWHQVVLAFYRYTFSSHFTIFTYAFFLVVVFVFSGLTYYYIEQKTSGWLKKKRSKLFIYSTTFLLFLCLTAFSGYIFYNAGVVRDVPELYIEKNNIHRGLHKEYNDRVYRLNKPFETEKRHWLVVGNSFGRDFCNVILESCVADSVEVSYISFDRYKEPKYAERFIHADKVFLSSLGTDEKTVKEMDEVCHAYGFNSNNLIIVGTKNFGESNGQFYINRNCSGYYSQRVIMEAGYYEHNAKMKTLLGDRYLDLIGLVIDETGTMPVFTPDHHFISQDCRHFSKGGAKYFSELIDWNYFLY